MKTCRILGFGGLLVFVVITAYLLGAQVTTIVHNRNSIRIRILKNQWKFFPDTIEASRGKPIELRVYNEDSYPHGFSILELGINQELPPMRETVISITPQQASTLGFYCSVLCGEGHYRMSGKLIIR